MNSVMIETQGNEISALTKLITTICFQMTNMANDLNPLHKALNTPFQPTTKRTTPTAGL